MTPKELREKSPQELQRLEIELREELFTFKMKAATGQLEKSHRLLEIKRDIARVLTLLRQQKA